jgi:hypothetical protein
MTKTHLENNKDDKRWQGNVAKRKEKTRMPTRNNEIVKNNNRCVGKA